MEMLRSGAKSRAGRWLAVGTALAIACGIWARNDDPSRKLIAATGTLDYRAIEGRFSDPFEHRPFRGTSDAGVPPAIRGASSELQKRWHSTPTPETGRKAAVGLLVAGHPDDASGVFAEALRRATGESDLLAAIHASRDAAVLIDFSAAALHRAHQDRRELLVALEAADRAWQLERLPAAAWNRALAAELLGLTTLAVQTWRSAAALETSPAWLAEAGRRAELAEKRAASAPEESAELFFHRELIERATAMLGKHEDSDVEIHRLEVVRGDSLASDSATALMRLRPTDRPRALAALASYTRGRGAYEHDRLEEARAAFAFAEAELGALRVPLALLARDQRIRAECSQSNPRCLENIQAFRTDLDESKRYPWLHAQATYAEGQTYYRRGRIYEAAEWLERARAEFHRLHDVTSAGVMHVLLANVFTTAGEPDVALAHYLEAIAVRSPQMGDRRRRQLEDAISFMLRHGYLSTAEALLGELATLPATDSAHVMEATLRGILHARRGDPRRSALGFERAHALLGSIADEALRSDMRMIVAVCEAGSRTDSPNAVLEQIDAAIAQHQDVDQVVWMPQLLAERGAALERRNELEQAERDYLQAIEILEQREPNIDQMLIGFGVGTSSESPFDRAIRLLLQQGRIADALTIAQRATSLRISALYAPAVGLRDVFRAAREPVKGDSVGALRRALPGQTAVVYHLLRDELVTWVITSDEIFAVRQRVRAKEVVRRVDRFRQCAARQNCREEDTVSDLLLHRWVEHVPRETTLLIQPPAELQGVPFAALRVHGGERLLQRNPIATAPSMRAFVRTTQMDTERTGATGTFFAAAGRPGGELAPLPLAIAEVRSAARYYPKPLVDPAARRTAFLERAPFHSIVHFAGHVLVNDQQPLRSALVFDGGERLYVHELGEEAFAHARMVVLSGCETGRSPRPTMSVAHALLSQGVPSVVYTLWPVTDDAARAFAVAFHRGIAAGMTRAEAVRQAQLAVMRQDPERVDGWAAFALAGTSGAIIRKRELSDPLMSMK